MLSVLNDLEVCSCLRCDAFVVIVLSDEPRQIQGLGLVDRKLVKAPHPSITLLLAVPRRLFGFGSLVVLDGFRHLFLPI